MSYNTNAGEDIGNNLGDMDMQQHIGKEPGEFHAEVNLCQSFSVRICHDADHKGGSLL